MSSSSRTLSGLILVERTRLHQCQPVEDQKKRKRMDSNRESARRARMKKQKHLHGLMAQLTLLKTEQIRVSSSLIQVHQYHSSVESENFVLNAQAFELSQRLQSLSEILTLISTTNGFACPMKIFTT